MTKNVTQVMGGICCCIEPPKPWCNDCPYEGIHGCENVLRDDISYWAQQGKLKLGKDGIYEPVGIDVKKIKTKRKNGRRYSDGERRKGRHEYYEGNVSEGDGR